MPSLTKRVRSLRPKVGLNPKLWDGETLKPKVADALKRIADQFLGEIGADIKVRDVIMTGSQAAATWDPDSDIDLHIVADLAEFGDPEDVKSLFKAVKSFWNMKHDITVMGIPVEVYVEDINDPPPEVTGRWSLTRASWSLSPPDHGDDTFETDKVMKTLRSYREKITAAIRSKDPKSIESVMDKITTARRDGITREGELATENIAYRVLRRMGIIERAWDTHRKLVDKGLSVQ